MRRTDCAERDGVRAVCAFFAAERDAKRRRRPDSRSEPGMGRLGLGHQSNDDHTERPLDGDARRFLAGRRHFFLHRARVSKRLARHRGARVGRQTPLAATAPSSRHGLRTRQKETTGHRRRRVRVRIRRICVATRLFRGGARSIRRARAAIPRTTQNHDPQRVRVAFTSVALSSRDRFRVSARSSSSSSSS